MNKTQLRWALTLTKNGTDGRGSNRVETFTWGTNYRAAYARVVAQIDEPVWEGWSFELSKRPVGA